MSVHLRREIESLKKKLLMLSAMVEETLQQAVRSVTQRDERMAKRLLERDVEIDEMEVEIEEDCLKVLALHQPVAIDLRFIIAVLKINNDLERIGDLASNIAERSVWLAGREPVSIPFDFPNMSGIAQRMLHQSLDALVNMDIPLAKQVRMTDDELDELNREMYLKVQQGILADPSHIEHFIQCLAISRQLERIGDHATNIAEDVIYMIEGNIVRHRMT